jgi:hypothetical protein
MPQYVSECTKSARDHPEERFIELVIRVDPEDLETATDWVQDNRGEIQLEREYGLLQFDIPETKVAKLCDQTYVRSVECTSDAIEVLNTGN